MTLKNTKSEPAQTAGNAPELKIPKYLQSSAKGMLRWRVATLLEQFNCSDIGLCKQIEELAWAFSERTGYFAGVAASSQEAAPPGFDEATEKRWQDAIYEVCKKAVGAQNDSLIDGGGTDSGDALDFTLTEIGQAFAFLEEKHAEPAPSPATKEMPPTIEHLDATEPIDGCFCNPCAARRYLGEMRQKFHVEATRLGWSTGQYQDGTYTNDFTDDAWQLWQAAVKSSSQGPAREETPPTNENVIVELQKLADCGWHELYEKTTWGPFYKADFDERCSNCKQRFDLLKRGFDAGAKSVVAAPQLTREEFETAASRLERFKYDFRRAMVRGEPTGEYLEPSTFNAWTGWQLAKSAWAGAAPQPKELAELLKRLMATNIKGAMLQLDDHFAGDERLVDTIRSLKRQLESALAGAAALPSAQNEWISVEERLPENVPHKGWQDHGAIYQATGFVLAFNGGFHVAEMLTNPSDGKVWVNGDETVKDVTHWRELPSPPVPSKEPK